MQCLFKPFGLIQSHSKSFISRRVQILDESFIYVFNPYIKSFRWCVPQDSIWHFGIAFLTPTKVVSKRSENYRSMYILCIYCMSLLSMATYFFKTRKNIRLVNLSLEASWDFLMHDYITCISVRFGTSKVGNTQQQDD